MSKWKSKKIKRITVWITLVTATLGLFLVISSALGSSPEAEVTSNGDDNVISACQTGGITTEEYNESIEITEHNIDVKETVTSQVSVDANTYIEEVSGDYIEYQENNTTINNPPISREVRLSNYEVLSWNEPNGENSLLSLILVHFEYEIAPSYLNIGVFTPWVKNLVVYPWNGVIENGVIQPPYPVFEDNWTWMKSHDVSNTMAVTIETWRPITPKPDIFAIDFAYDL